jgi:tetratricopeptide (TPR) repeat protein
MLALVLVMLAGVACAMFAVLHRSPPAPAPAGSNGEVDLLLGLGDYPEALKVAERRWGKASKEYQAAVLRQSESLRQDCELRAQESLRRRDWRAAAEGFERALPGAGAEHGRELKAALQLSRDLAQAGEFEASQRHAEALALYRRYGDRAPSLKDYLRERIARVQEAIDHSSKK